MGYFDDEKNVRAYIEMAEGFDGRELIETVRRYVKEGSSVLELGMGPGKDLDILKRYFTVTGSDSSEIFLNRYRERNRNVDLLLLDAATLKTDRTFDCIYSNKVLIHLTKTHLRESLKRQLRILSSGGILFHSFWEGDMHEEMNGLLFTYYKNDELGHLFREHYDLLEMESYGEIAKGDSIYVVAKKSDV
jgi:trans-aconitate methyltransferase